MNRPASEQQEVRAVCELTPTTRHSIKRSLTTHRIQAAAMLNNLPYCRLVEGPNYVIKLGSNKS